MATLEIDTYFDLHDYEHRALFENCIYPWDALNNIEIYFQNFFKNNKSTNQKTHPGSILVDPETIFIGEGTTVEPGVYIEGPCIIGKNCTLRHGAYIRKNVITGNGCVIGNSTELKNVILLNHAHLAHHAYGGDSIFGNHCNLGAGAKCANLKFDNTEIIINHEGNRIKTGLRKFGAIIGDKVQLGCNSVTNPGTMLGKNSFLYPCTNFGGNTPPGSTIRSDAKVTVFSQKAKR